MKQTIVSQKRAFTSAFKLFTEFICSPTTFPKKIPPLNNNSFERIMAENFPQLMSDIKRQIQEVQRIPSRKKSQKNFIPRHIVFNYRKSKIKKKNILKRSQRVAKQHPPYLQRSKDNYYIQLLSKHAMRSRVEWNT